MSDKKLRPETIAVSGGHVPDSDTGSRAVPIYQTTSFMFKDAEHAARLFNLDEPGNIYTRIMNPTNDAFEKRVALLHNAPAALAVGSGQAACSIALLNIASSGDEIVSSSSLYGGTHTLFAHTFKRMGITVKFCAPNDIEAFKNSVTDRTKAFYVETIGNPGLDVADMEALSSAAHEAGVPLVVDNTVAPYIFNPIDHGADIVFYSATKFISGHGTSIGGVIIDSGRFKWTQEKFPTIAGPDESYHGIDFVEKFRDIAYIVKARVCLTRDLGPALSPFNAFMFIQGLETLHLRMPRHCENALALAKYLEQNPYVEWVNYPGLDSNSQKALADKYLPNGAGALIGFGIRGGFEAGKKFINALELVSHLANIGDARTLAIHPASTTHQQLSETEQKEAGVTQDFIRLSVGIEHIDDIIADIEQALKKAGA